MAITKEEIAKDKQIAKLVEQYGSEKAVLAAYKKKKKREAASAAKLAPEAARAKKNMAAKKVDSGMAEYLKVLAKDPKTIKERKKRSLKNLEESRILELEGDKEDFRSAELRSRQALVEDKESKKQEEKNTAKMSECKNKLKFQEQVKV